MKPAKPRILTINGGSSSIKFAIYQVGEPLERKLDGKIDRIGLSGTTLTFNDSASNPSGQLQPRRVRSQVGGEFPDGLARRDDGLRIGPGCGAPRGPWHEPHPA